MRLTPALTADFPEQLRTGWSSTDIYDDYLNVPAGVIAGLRHARWEVKGKVKKLLQPQNYPSYTAHMAALIGRLAAEEEAKRKANRELDWKPTAYEDVLSIALSVPAATRLDVLAQDIHTISSRRKVTSEDVSKLLLETVQSICGIGSQDALSVEQTLAQKTYTPPRFPVRGRSKRVS